MSNRFDPLASTWDDHPDRHHLTDDLIKALQRWAPLQSDWDVLDYGCGTGALTIRLAPLVRQVLAIDSSRGMLEVLATKAQSQGLTNIECLQTDFETAPPPHTRCHLIVSAMTLHHLATIDRVLHRFFQLLTPGGYLALADLDEEDGSFHGQQDGVHHHGFNRERLTEQLAAVGFHAIDISTVTHRVKNSRRYPVFLAKARKP
ncbi:MAG: methyltransferase domain-containing protein [Kiritimatiellae bacterium]|nr:methyltransferase domain-containing protein [Kiritimatiellia bacterium]MDD4341003.1 methyltransferase domain-containing protein [Kiritimatiellia bacterium]